MKLSSLRGGLWAVLLLIVLLVAGAALAAPQRITRGTGLLGGLVVTGPATVGGKVTLQGGTATATAGAATLNSSSGVITSESITTAAGSDYTLTLTNSEISATCVVLASVSNGTNTTEGLAVQRVTPGSGSVVIKVRNTHASSALNGTVKIAFVVFQ